MPPEQELEVEFIKGELCDVLQRWADKGCSMDVLARAAMSVGVKLHLFQEKSRVGELGEVLVDQLALKALRNSLRAHRGLPPIAGGPSEPSPDTRPPVLVEQMLGWECVSCGNVEMFPRHPDGEGQYHVPNRVVCPNCVTPHNTTCKKVQRNAAPPRRGKGRSGPPHPGPLDL